MAINCILETGLTAFCPFRKVKGQAACPCGVRPRTCDRHGKRPGQPGFPALPPVMLSGAAGAADSIMGSGTSAGGVLRLLQATSPPRSTRMISRATSPPRPCGCVCLVPGPPTERLRPGVRGWRAARYEAPEIHAAAPVGEVIPTAPHPPAAPDREDREGSPTRTRQGTDRS